MSQTVNLDTKYSKKIDQAFTIASLLKGRLSAENEFVGARTVRIHNINTVPLNDYNRGASANRYGEPAEVGHTVQELTMTQDKSFSGVIDKGNNMDQSINKAGKFLGVEMSAEVIPAYDKYCFGRLCTLAGKIVGSADAVSGTNVIKRMSAARKWMLDRKVPLKGRTWYVRSDVFTALVECDQFKNLEKLGTKAVAQGQVGELFGAPVVEVPEDYFVRRREFHSVCTSARRLRRRKSTTARRTLTRRAFPAIWWRAASTMICLCTGTRRTACMWTLPRAEALRCWPHRRSPRRAARLLLQKARRHTTPRTVPTRATA